MSISSLQWTCVNKWPSEGIEAASAANLRVIEGGGSGRKIAALPLR